MANKGNTALAAEREAVAAYYMFAYALSNDLNQKRREIAASIAYLTSDENLPGEDTEPFKETMEAINSILATVKVKADTVTSLAAGMATRLGDHASVRGTTLKEAKENMEKAIGDVKSGRRG